MTRRLRRGFACGALGLALMLAGCASLTPPAGQAPMATAPYHDAIDVNGRLSVQYEQYGRPQALHGSFEWSQTRQQIHLSLLSPLGQTVATIDVRPGMATLVQSGRAPQVAADVDALAAQALGWPLPVSGLRQWLQGAGLDASGKPFQAHGEDGARFDTRDGWRLTYVNWENDPAAGGARPRRIDLTRDTEPAGPVSIRIAIDGWTPH